MVVRRLGMRSRKATLAARVGWGLNRWMERTNVGLVGRLPTHHCVCGWDTARTVAEYKPLVVT